MATSNATVPDSQASSGGGEDGRMGLPHEARGSCGVPLRARLRNCYCNIAGGENPGMQQANAPSLRFSGIAFLTLVVALLAGCASAPPAATSQPPAPAPSARPAPVPTPSPAPKAADDERGAPAEASRAGSRTSAPARARPASARRRCSAAFDDVQYLPRVVELDRAQPEFTRTVWDYLDNTVTRPTRRARPGQAGAGPRRSRRRGARATACRRPSWSPSGAWRATTAATTAAPRPSTRWRRWASKAAARTGRGASCWRR